MKETVDGGMGKTGIMKIREREGISKRETGGGGRRNKEE